MTPVAASIDDDLPGQPTVLLVDDDEVNLLLTSIALREQGFSVTEATSGERAIELLRDWAPDVVVLDALMPGLDGFDLCRRIKANPAWSHIPVIFMTGLSETSHIVQGFDAGGVDYVVKPLRAQEVLVRLATHLRNARAVRMARDAVDIGGHGVLMIDALERIAWMSPQAQRWIGEFFDAQGDSAFMRWLTGIDDALAGGLRTLTLAGRTLTARRLGSAGLGETMWLLGLREGDAGAPSRLTTAALTPRETEVLSWIAKGKTNRDVGQILGLSPRTVNKHLEHVFEKLGVETRAAAAALASRELG